MTRPQVSGETGEPSAGSDQPGSVAADASQGDMWEQCATHDRDQDEPLSIAEGVRYERGLELGRGGMGRVVAARDLRLGRQVALKEVRPGINQRTAAAQLIAEAQLAAGLDHPGIVAIHDAGRDAQGQPFYTMRLVRGRTLHQAARLVPTQTERLRLMQPLLAACHAVAHAHTRSIVHRDIKPDNLLVGPHGETQVADWGLACTLAQAAVGGVVGTVGFMAPEVAAGQPASPRSDVYSLGATLVAVLHAADPGADLTRLAATLPPELRAIAERCLDPDPLCRYPDAERLAEDVSAWLDGRRVTAHSYSAVQLLGRLWRTFRIPIAVGVVGLLLITVVTWQGYRRTVRQRDRAIAAERLARGAQSQSEKNLAAAYGQAAESMEATGAHPEAETMAAAAVALSPAPASRGILARVTEGPELALTLDVPLPSCRQLRFSPEGKWLLCIKDDEALLWRGDDGQLQWRRPGTFVDGAISSSAGRVLLTDPDYLGLSLDLTTGATVTSGLPLCRRLDPVVQRDTKWIALFGVTHVDLLDMATNTIHHVDAVCSPTDRIAAAAFATAPATLLIACDSGRLYRAAVGRAAESLASAVTLSSPGGASALAVTSDGKVLLGTRDGRLWVDGREHPGWSGGIHRLQPSVQSLWTGPDGSVAVVGEGLGPMVWSQLAQKPVRLPLQDRRAVAFIDAHTVAVAGERLRHYTMRPLAHPARWVARAGLSQLSVSPDGSLLAAGGGDGTVTVWHSTSQEVVLQRKLTAGVVLSVAFSPDGQRLAVGMGAEPGFVVLQVGSWESLPAAKPVPIKRLGYFANGLLWRSTYAEGVDLVDAQGIHQALRSELLAGGPGPAAVNAPQTTLVSCNQWGDIVLIDQRDPQHLELLVRAPGIAALALSSDRRTVAVAEASRVRLLDVASRRFTAEIADPGQHITHVEFSPDDRLLLAGELDRSVRVWLLANSVELAVLRGHGQRVSDIAFGPGTLGLLSASWDGTIVRWDLGRLVAPADTLTGVIAARWGIQVDEALRSPIR